LLLGNVNSRLGKSKSSFKFTGTSTFDT
jgi:hypothetical protein